MQKPIFAKIRRWKPAEIREIRKILRCSREQFARYFPVSAETIKKWERGERNIYGPSSTLLQQLKEYTDYVKAEREKVLKKCLGRS